MRLFREFWVGCCCCRCLFAHSLCRFCVSRVHLLAVASYASRTSGTGVYGSDLRVLEVGCCFVCFAARAIALAVVVVLLAPLMRSLLFSLLCAI